MFSLNSPIATHLLIKRPICYRQVTWLQVGQTRRVDRIMSWCGDEPRRWDERTSLSTSNTVQSNSQHSKWTRKWPCHVHCRYCMWRRANVWKYSLLSNQTKIEPCKFSSSASSRRAVLNALVGISCTTRHVLYYRALYTNSTRYVTDSNTIWVDYGTWLMVNTPRFGTQAPSVLWFRVMIHYIWDRASRNGVVRLSVGRQKQKSRDFS